jgi:SEC-C motif-containing protein
MDPNTENCYCGNPVKFGNCCGPLLSGATIADSAQALMRSRFSAYCLKNYQYILDTYAEAQRQSLTVQTLGEHSASTQWLCLQVLSQKSLLDSAQVEFKAYYKIDRDYFVMHEVSDFVCVHSQWLYTTGKQQRGSGQFTPKANSRCLCASGKKFKKCCAR